MNKFMSILEHAGKDVEKVFVFAAKPQNLAAEETLATILLPGSAPVIALVANTALAIEQKYAAMGKQNGTGVQKAAAVSAIVSPAIEQILGPNVDAKRIIDAVVMYLNAIAAPGVVIDAPAAAAAPKP